MRPLSTLQQNHRLLLMILLLVMGFTTGFVWGLDYGYERGKADTVRAIEQKLAKPERADFPL